MCCRCTLVKFIDEILTWFDVMEDVMENETGLDQNDLFENYNVSPGNPLPVVISNEDRRSLQLLQWGLIPRWHKDQTRLPALYNTRVETAHEKPSFRHLVQRHRAVAVCDGYYEWQKEGSKKIP